MTNKMPVPRMLFTLAGWILLLALAGCSSGSDTSGEGASALDAPKVDTPRMGGPNAMTGDSTSSKIMTKLDVYKSPTCGCCEGWLEHLDSDTFDVAIHHPPNFSQIKDQYRIAPKYQSCHTAVSPDGYVFEGHVPQKYIKQFLAEKPAGAIGLAVPGMPLGTPGMEMGGKFTPYQILLLSENGESSVYAEIGSREQQFD